MAFGPARRDIRPELAAGTVVDSMPDQRYMMARPFWRQMLDSPRVVRSLVGAAFYLWIILYLLGILDLWDLLTVVLAIAGLDWMMEHGPRNPSGWLAVGAGVLVQVGHLGEFSGGVQLGIWMAFAIVAFGALWQSGTIRTRRTVRLRGWRDSHVDLSYTGGTLRARGDVRRGEITCRLCDVVVDLRYVDITRPPTILDVTCVAGRLDLVVPIWWRIGQNVNTTLSRLVLEARIAGEHGSPRPQSWYARMRPVGSRRRGFRKSGDPEPDAGFVNLLVQGSSHFGRIRILHA